MENDSWGNDTFWENKTTEISYGLYEQPFSIILRVTVLSLLAIMGIFGNSAVFVWMCRNMNNRRWSRFHVIFLHLAISDTLVVACATAPQIIWDYKSREWFAGDLLCRCFKFTQTFTICASHYLTVAIAIDRYRAIRKPMELRYWKVNILGGGSWIMAAVVNSPIFFIFKQSRHNGQLVCRNTLYDLPPVILRMYLTAVVVLVFIAPLIAISICYLQIFRKIAEKAREGNEDSDRRHKEITGPPRFLSRKRKFTIPRASNTFLPKAKIKTLKMTLVIITSFLVCSAPYCIVEMWRVYGDYKALDATTYSILAALAVSNSSTNPFVFLAFHFASGQRRGSRPGIKSECAILGNCCCYCCQGCYLHRGNDTPNWVDAPSEYKETLSTADVVPLDRLTSNSSTSGRSTTQIVTFNGENFSQKTKKSTDYVKRSKFA